MNLLEEIRNDAAGAALLADWLGDGGQPVDRKLSEWRAFVCTAGHVGRPCPFNVEPNWWDRIKSAIADSIRGELALKDRMAVSTSKDQSLHMCKVCGCCTRLKVHTPIEHIDKHTSERVRERFPPWCWIRRELALLKKRESENVNHG